MTGPVDQDVPLLGLGRDQVQAWTQFMLVTANAVRQYRVNRGRSAWSQERAAARATQRYSNDLDPRVRAMVEADEAAFQAARRRDPSSFEDKTSGERQFGWVVHTTTGPMPEESPSGMHGAWGLWADGWLAEKKLSVFVVADKETALRLRDEVTEGEQRTLKDLGELGTYGHMRAEHARTEVREEPWQLRERVWGNLREVWPNDSDLAAAVMTPSPYWNGDGDSEEQRYGAIDRLATRLRGLEDHGYSMTDVVRRLDLGAIRQQYEAVEWHLLADFVDQMVQRTADQLQVVDADPVDPVVAREVDEALDRGLRDAGVARDGVLRSEYFDQLRAQLTDLRSAGRDLDALLADLPTEKINQAQHPAAYLRAVVEERARSAPTDGPSTYEPGRDPPERIRSGGGRADDPSALLRAVRRRGDQLSGVAWSGQAATRVEGAGRTDRAGTHADRAVGRVASFVAEDPGLVLEVGAAARHRVPRAPGPGGGRVGAVAPRRRPCCPGAGGDQGVRGVVEWCDHRGDARRRAGAAVRHLPARSDQRGRSCRVGDGAWGGDGRGRRLHRADPPRPGPGRGVDSVQPGRRGAGSC
ncbi:hypothetical protein Ae168Ps1_6444c [Pseudonocardia sp. Ae168_Ps1]|nr:hypothetical protein Ae168Ps1_6444c [Pseudonocardia sp. Ae168_Ps1]OLL69873.1 hypothetical protein Ae263Ps1_6410 [Pseudonocardia sp. Ae263_Ps1]OLL88977.1 hypothetical protein Ae356Ps1_6367 [Pseudonocardia sp. Ae356_Ps1]